MTGAEHGAFSALNAKINNIMLSMANASDVAFYKAKYEEEQKKVADLQKQLEKKEEELNKFYGILSNMNEHLGEMSKKIEG